MKNLSFAYLVILGLLAVQQVQAQPQLYVQPDYESPVRADPDDLLQLRGDELSATDQVVYQAVSNTTIAPSRPTSVPTNSDSALGVLDLVSTVDTPYSLTVHLPTVMTANQSYALWIYDSKSKTWSSSPLLINDARPLWITPDFAYETATYASLPRFLKIVGRNLQPAPGQTTQVRLVGPQTYTLTAALNTNQDPTSNPQIARYVALVQLPSTMAAGTYSVSVSRDGVSWVGMPNQPPGDGTDGGSAPQQFQVLTDPTPAASFQVSQQSSGCNDANGTEDNTLCVLMAIDAANANGGGNVVFGPGTWTITSPTGYAGSNGYTSPSVDTRNKNGIVICPGVNLVGSGSTPPVIQMNALTWAAEKNGTPYPIPFFTLVSFNQVHNLHLAERYQYSSSTSIHYHYIHVMQVGLSNANVPAVCGNLSSLSASHVAIYDNIFDKPYIALMAGAQPVDHLYVVNNTFGGFYRGTYLQGVRISDSIIDFNTYEPSSFIQPGYPTNTQGQGVIASELNSSVRTDFSNNFANGSTSATRFLYNPTDPTGWRAAFFFDLNQNDEMTLVSQNKATCTGDKAGDGESFSFDNNGNSYEFTQPEAIISASSNPSTSTIVLSVPSGTLVNASGDYAGFWLQIVKGDGISQVRKIVSNTVSEDQTTVTIVVSPALDVLPVVDASSGTSESFATVSKEYWQVYTVDNLVDNRTPLCTQGNVDWASGDAPSMPRNIGQMNYYGATAESVFEGNVLYDSGGILLQHQAPTQFHAYDEVRNNVVNGEFAYGNDCSWGGVMVSLVGDSADSTAPLSGYGTSIAGNTISQADGFDGGAIDLVQTGRVGTTSGPWGLEDNALIFGNSITETQDGGPGGPSACRSYKGRPAITQDVYASGGVAWHSVLYNNSFAYPPLSSQPSDAIEDNGTGTVRYCPTQASGSVECLGETPVDVGVSASWTNPTSGPATVTFAVTVRNNSASAANNVSLSWEPSSGLVVTGASPPSGHCDIGQNVCPLGIVAAQSTETITVTANVDSGTWPLTFSVTHTDPDNLPSNNSENVQVRVP